jgi:ABC-type dipeptide/oligopeptide/nickel transport system permease component
MTNYLIRRIFQMMIVVLLSTMAIYVILNIAPGGPLSGLRLSADRRNRVTDQDIARISAYLGLDKPLALRYLTWLIGDDWLGADWLYVGLSQYKFPLLGAAGEPRFGIDSDTGEKVYETDSARFWANPGVPSLEPTYKLWVWGDEVAPGEFNADKIQVKPPATRAPDDVVASGEVLSKNGSQITLVDLNNNKYLINTNPETEWAFPKGEGQPRPEGGTWLNIAWLTGVDGVLAKYSGFHGINHGILRMDFGFSWRLSPSQPVTGLLMSRLGNTLILMITASVFSLVVAIPIGIYSAVHQYSKVDYAVTTFAFFGSAMPVFWFGLMLILIFSYGFKTWGLPFFPSGGVTMVREAPEGSLLNMIDASPGSLVDRVTHIILPAVMLSLLYMAGWSRYMRSSMLEVFAS